MESGAPPAAITGELSEVIRRVVAAKVYDPHDVEDIVQETLVKVAAAETRLGPNALQGYAIVTARNLVAGRARDESTRKRHLHRLVDYTSLDGPEELALEREETDALAAALLRLDGTERALLLAHEVNGVDTASLADAEHTTSGAIAVRLARARARLRVEFLLAFRGVTLPEPRCRTVLLALSSGDRRRQRSLRAGDHLLTCPTCASLSSPLVERRRSIAGVIPFFFVDPFKALGRLARNGKAQAAAAVVTAAAVTAGVVALSQPADPPNRPPTTQPAAISSTVMTGTQRLLPIPARGLAPFVGRIVRVRNAPVFAVPADEGAWIGTSNTARIWVQFSGSGESPFDVSPGQHLTFDARLVGFNPALLATARVPAPDLAAIAQQKALISVPFSAVAIR